MVRLEHADEHSVVTSTFVDPALLVFAGHYPGFPIFPGVCLIDCAHHSVLVNARRLHHDVRLESVKSTRFLSPVYPGDHIDTSVGVKVADGRWKCEASLRTERGPAAVVRLSYIVRAPS